ncbi:PiggyBac transposable element-derived protein 4 [Zootermopsis nevadensis]|uniref:PiggyBac transposable element-derived protein 4 n=1 Tax=Zootermopsis nevadensis TaxID=136037 RepID=A0A067QJ20_ZOONE|nr:PiggyBac transposable element-derived protein 4 [Zootermopsis nevadensis]
MMLGATAVALLQRCGKTKGILFLSNFHDPQDVNTVARKNKDGTSENISCPEIVKQYNANMRFVDKADMLKSLYEIDRKSQKWWLRIFWHFLDVSVVNAFILYKKRSLEARTLTLRTLFEWNQELI